MRRKRRRRLVGCNRGVCGVDRGDSGLGLQKGEGGKGERVRRRNAVEAEVVPRFGARTPPQAELARLDAEPDLLDVLADTVAVIVVAAVSFLPALY